MDALPLLTLPTLIIASVVVVSALAWAIAPLKRAFVFNPYLVRERFQVHRLLTAGWLHADTTHLLFNMITLHFFADHVVRALGPTRFVFLYVSAVVFAHVPTLLRHMKDPRYNSLGASGAVSAVVFSTILLHPQMKMGLMFVPIPVPGFVYAFVYLAYSAWSSFQARGGINHGAHIAGALYGAGLTFAFEPDRATRAVQSLF